MRQTNFALAILTAAVLSACGGSGNDTPAAQPKPQFAAQVSFGDSLSDVGTYKVGAVAALGGGKYTINGPTAKNWTEIMAANAGLAAPCPAVTGLTGNAGVNPGFVVPVTDFPSCNSYAMGGARVTNPKGPGSLAAGSALGQLTYPVVDQVTRHLSRHAGAFSATDVVYVMAGGNDALQLLADLTAAATAEGTTVGGQTYFATLIPLLAGGATNPTTAAAAIGAAVQTASAQPGATQTTITMAAIGTAAAQPGNLAVGSAAVYGPMVQTATTAATTAGNKAAADYGAANGPALVPMMAQAGKELSDVIRNQIVGKGAKYVVLVNLPDLASSPSAKAQSASSQQLIAGMVNGFNIALRVGIDGLESKVLYVDLFTQTQLQVANPSTYGYTNTSAAACGTNPLGGTSLVCNSTNTLAGVDVSKYMFADSVHPTPYANTLIAQYVTDQMKARGWL
jgi:phospholipase/lecithinase/hemolysin